MYDFDNAQSWSLEAMGGFADDPAEEGWTDAFVAFWFPVAIETLGLVFLLKNSGWGHAPEQSTHSVDSWSARTLCERVAEALVARAERGGLASRPSGDEVVEIHVLVTEALLGGLLQDPQAMEEPFCCDCLTHWLKRRGAAWPGAERRPFMWFQGARDCTQHQDRLKSALTRVKQPDVGHHADPLAEGLEEIGWTPAEEVYSVQAIPMRAAKLRAGTFVLLGTLGLGASVAGMSAAAGTPDTPAFTTGTWDVEEFIELGGEIDFELILPGVREPPPATATPPPPPTATPPLTDLPRTTFQSPSETPGGQVNPGDGPGPLPSPHPEPSGPPRIDGDSGRRLPGSGGAGGGPPRIEPTSSGTGSSSGSGRGAGGGPGPSGKQVLSQLATDLSEAIQTTQSRGLTCGGPFTVSGGLKRGGRDPVEQDIPEIRAALQVCNRILNAGRGGGSPPSR